MLSGLSREAVTVTASSELIERSFSTAPDILSAKRNRMKPDLLRSLLMLCNSRLNGKKTNHQVVLLVNTLSLFSFWQILRNLLPLKIWILVCDVFKFNLCTWCFILFCHHYSWILHNGIIEEKYKEMPLLLFKFNNELYGVRQDLRKCFILSFCYFEWIKKILILPTFFIHSFSIWIFFNDFSNILINIIKTLFSRLI